MKWLYLFFVFFVVLVISSAHAGSPLLLLGAGSGNVPATTTISTLTFINSSGSTLTAGTPVTMGMAFRSGDIQSGYHPVIADNSTGNPLSYQWDEISTRIENGDNGSWRHGVWTIQLPYSVANNATFQLRFIPTAGSYSQSQVLAPSALCTGPNSRDLKIRLTDIRNQDDTVRDSGAATFDLCTNLSNTGRDAPRILRSGSLMTEVEINGLFVYDTSGDLDPLLYASCIVDLFVDASTGNTLKDTRWVCHVISPWMSVSAGNAGNAGATTCNGGHCPNGFTNDPQIVSYRPSVLDGSTTVLDYSNLDATLTSSNNPVIGCPAGDTYGGPNCLTVPTSTADANAWYWPMTVRITNCTGTCVAGLTQGQLAWVYPAGIAAARAFSNTTTINLLATPQFSGASANTSVLTNSQGTGTTSLQFRIWHPKWASWQTLDASGDENWSLAGGTTRVTRRIYPKFTSVEQTYWEETGLIPPLLLSQSPSVSINYGETASPPNYNPMGRMIVIGMTSGGTRPDIGIINDFAGQAFITQTSNDWYNARLFSYGAQAHGWMAILNEATGRIPPLNNGPPGGGGFGTGASYSQLGAPFPQAGFTGNGLTTPLQNVPNATFDWAGGMWGKSGTSMDHTPAFGSLTYIIWGSQQFLDLMRWNANHDIIQTNTYANEPGLLYYGVRDVQLPSGPGSGTAYYCNVLYQYQNRGSAWMLRDMLLPASLGSDTDQERTYYSDCLKEIQNSYPVILTFMDGTSTGAVENSMVPPNFGGNGATQTIVDLFMTDYGFDAAYQLRTFQHSTMAKSWFTIYTKYIQGILGGGTVANSLDPYYGVDFSGSPAIHNGDGIMTGAVTGGNIGQYYNSTDAADYGGFTVFTSITNGIGQLQQIDAPPYTLTVGDFVKWVGPAYYGNSSEAIDQLPGNTWFKVIGPINNTTGTYYIENPATPGVAFTQFTRSGVSFSETNGPMIYRPTFVPSPAVQDFADHTYCYYARQIMDGLTVLGYDVSTPKANFLFRLQGNINNCTPSAPVIWDSTVVVPGIL